MPVVKRLWVKKMNTIQMCLKNLIKENIGRLYSNKESLFYNNKFTKTNAYKKQRNTYYRTYKANSKMNI